jgi:hypothetical protein
MPIRVTTKKLKAWHNDLADEIKVDMLNEVVEEYATEAQKELGKLTCKEHPRKISQLTIIADRINTMVIEKKFCCAEFEDKVSLKIER